MFGLYFIINENYFKVKLKWFWIIKLEIYLKEVYFIIVNGIEIFIVGFFGRLGGFFVVK